MCGHSVVLTGLSPKTEYEFTVIPGQGEDEPITAMTSNITVTTAE